MSHPELEPLDPDLDALLEAERRAPPEATEMRNRVVDRVLATIGPVGGGVPPSGAPAPPTGASGALLGPLGKSILLGAALGGLVATTILAPRGAATIATVATSAPRLVASQGRADDGPLPPPDAPPAHEAPRRAPPRASPDRGRAASFAAERILLDEAQRAFADGNIEQALAALDRHKQAFPHGALDEEREGLAIRALVRVGKTDEALARAASLRAAHPHSIQLPAMELDAGTIP